ncbi:MAG: lytic murein transglycosylase [Alphaproteobacteria bacterium]|nr:lytic murein transglycosylase [Alphaproteobacteria bacterium]
MSNENKLLYIGAGMVKSLCEDGFLRLFKEFAVNLFACLIVVFVSIVSLSDAFAGEAKSIEKSTEQKSAGNSFEQNSPEKSIEQKQVQKQDKKIVTSVHDAKFNKWIADLRKEAIAEGMNKDIVLKALPDDIKLIPKIISIDRKQPEFVRDLHTYLTAAVNKKRIHDGRKMLKKHGKILEEISAKYGVKPYNLMALWGVETNYGTHVGRYPIINVLVTLAYDTRRTKFFKKELKHALTMLNNGDVKLEDFKGSWAGAMGQFQFMPSTFMAYAVDYDGDGKKDIWNNHADAFASAANYLSSIGWKSKQKWGREVVLPKDFKAFDDIGLEYSFPLDYWKGLGLKTPFGNKIPVAKMVEGSLLLPEGYRGAAFLVYYNFHMILDWNRSINYALAIGELSNRLAGRSAFQKIKPLKEKDRLSRHEISVIQQNMLDKGIYKSKVDGYMGRYTRRGVRILQRSFGLPADGYPTKELLDKISTKNNVDEKANSNNNVDKNNKNVNKNNKS